MENFEGVPNRLIPSDHFAIAADFTYWPFFNKDFIY